MATGGWTVDETDNNIGNVCEEETYTTHTHSENLENDEDIPSILVSSMDVGRETASFVRRRVQHLANTDQCVKILFVGKAGAGKSSLINGLVGKKIAKEGAGAEPVTGVSALKNPYKCERQVGDSLVHILVWDSPGLQDGYQDDENYLKCLRVVLSQVDLVVYCINSKERFDKSAQRALRKFVEMKPEIWSHTVIALTQANLIIHPDDNPTKEEKTTHFKGIMTQWRHDICNVLQRCRIPNDVIQRLPFVPTGYHRVTHITPQPWSLHPNCDHWIQAFWVNCLGRCKERGQQALVTSNRHRLSFNGTLPDGFRTLPIENQPINCGNDDMGFAQQVCQGTHAAGDTELSWYIRIWHFLRNLFFKCE